MDYTLAGIRNRVLVDKLDDEEFNPDIVDNFINDTQRNIFNQYELSFQEKIFKGTVPAATTMFAFPTDVALLQSLVVTGPDCQYSIKETRFEFRDFNARFPVPENNEAGPILFWTLYAGNMILANPTDQDYQLTAFYIKKPKTLAVDTDVPELPEEFAELLVLGAFIRVLKHNEDYDLAANLEVEYNNQLNLLVARYGGRIADSPHQMKSMKIRKR